MNHVDHVDKLLLKGSLLSVTTCVFSSRFSFESSCFSSKKRLVVSRRILWFAQCLLRGDWDVQTSRRNWREVGSRAKEPKERQQNAMNNAGDQGK